jgi:two-component system, LytTR family, sensor histidine kinase AlgZ
MTGLVKDIVFQQQYRGLRHILFWIGCLVCFCVLHGSDLRGLGEPVVITLSTLPVVIGYAYMVAYVFVPVFLFKRRYAAFFAVYCLWAVLGLSAIFLFRYYILTPFWTGVRAAPLGMGGFIQGCCDLGNFMLINTTAMVAAFVRMLKQWHIEVTQQIRIEQEKKNAELELLKAQLHPHFLFNTLNNLYSLVLEQSDRAGDLLLRLSGLLNYVLYDCKAKEVSLEKEIGVMKDYIALEWERYGSRLEISQDFLGELEGKVIAPMLFQPFVENAFKHGTSEQVGRVWMTIELTVKKEKLFFRVMNSVDWAVHTPQPGGIGIKNTRRRLDLLYPGKHSLHQVKNESAYIVELIIELGSPEPVRNWLAPATAGLYP